MRPEYIEQIKQHAKAEFPKEACGLIVKSLNSSQIIALPLKNIARFPELYFQVPTEEYLKYKLNGTLLAVYHSHPRGTKEPSEADIKSAEELILPSVIYSLYEDDFTYYAPSQYVTPLEGRMFVPLVFDCVSFVRDYYKQTFNLEYPMFPRKVEHIREGLNIVNEYCLANGFIKSQAPIPNSVVVMTLLGSEYPNHVGVYLGKGIMLHQLVGRVSCREVYGGYWEKHTNMFLVPPAFKEGV